MYFSEGGVVSTITFPSLGACIVVCNLMAAPLNSVSIKLNDEVTSELMLCCRSVHFVVLEVEIVVEVMVEHCVSCRAAAPATNAAADDIP